MGYWWSARIASIALVIVLFQLWAEKDPQTEINGTALGLGLVLLLALVPQILILAGTIRSGRNIPGLPVDIYLTLSTLAVVGTVSAIVQPDGLWTTIVVFALAAVTVGILALAATLPRDLVASPAWAAPVAMLALAPCSIGQSWRSFWPSFS